MKQNGDVVLADFGISEILVDGMSTVTGRPLNEHCGTHGYMAPEIVLRKEYSFGVDVWSAGVVAYECLVNDQPFSRLDELDLESKFLEWEDERDSVLDLERIPSEFSSLISETLTVNNRSSSSNILEMLNTMK